MATDLDPNAPCFCGSRDPYKNCHRDLHRTSPGRYLDAARKFYINRWVKNAGAHRRADDYGWMADQVTGPVRRVLDVGIGEGSGVLALIDRFGPELLVALEENPECVRRARTKLAAANMTITVSTRMETVPVAKGAKDYDLCFTAGPIQAVDGLTIVLTDPLFDVTLTDDLAGAGPFDLVTVWLMGSHEARENSRDLMALGHMSAAKYRLFVQNVAYELADKLLMVGGRLQIVDRLQTHDPESLRAELLKSHIEQAEPTTLEVTDITFRDYAEATTGAVKMLLTDDGQGTPVPAGQRQMLVSIVSVKR